MPTLLVAVLMLALPTTPQEAAPPGAPQAMATPAELSTEVAWGCLQSPSQLMTRMRGSAFSAWTQGWALPTQPPGTANACVSCTLSLTHGPSCDWRSVGHAAVPPAEPGSRCPELGAQDAFGAIDFTALLQGWLVQAPPSSGLPQLSRRLGLDEIKQVCYGGRLRSAKAWGAEVLIRVSSATHGVFATLGPPVSPQLPIELGLSAVQSASVSVIPARVWNLLETLVAGAMPLQYTLLRVQLDAIERSEKTHWAEDVLGHKPALWSLYQDRSGAWVGLLEGADGPRAVTFLAAAVEGLSDMLPGLSFNVFKKGVTTATLTVPAGAAGPGATVHLAFLPKRIVVATTPGALQPYLKKRDRAAHPGVLRAASAVAFGTQDASREALWMRWLPADFRPSFIKNARSVWFFSPEPQGWRGSVEMTVERQTFGQ